MVTAATQLVPDRKYPGWQVKLTVSLEQVRQLLLVGQAVHAPLLGP